MENIKMIVFMLLCLFYAAYLIKMILLRRQGVSGDLLGKGGKPSRAKSIEVLLKIVTYAGAAGQFISVFFAAFIPGFTTILPVQLIGLCLMAGGCVLFLLAVITMKNNWRAGYSTSQNTSLVTTGIYKISRNPAFAGFDLLYIGCSLVYLNCINIIFTVAAIILFHIQITGEEKHLIQTFGQRYADYKATVRRYL